MDQKCGTAKKEAELDKGLFALRDEVVRYGDCLDRLHGHLESPRPICESKEAAKSSQTTLAEYVQQIHNRLVNENERLISITTRISEQVGELKLLP